MKKSLKATSIIEAIVVLIVVVTGIVGVYDIMISSQRLSNSTSDRIEAIQIARDGLEAFINMRDTNWQLFAADYENCWNTLNYSGACIGNSGITGDIRHFSNEGIRIYRNSNNQFQASRQSYTTGSFLDANYRDFFQVRKDSRGFYDQAAIWPIYGNGVTPKYTREIKLDYLNGNNVSQGPNLSNNPKMTVTAIIQWYDPASRVPRKLEMSTTLTNWKAKK